MEKNATVLASKVRVVGPTASSSKKQKVKADLSHLTVQFEGLNDSEYWKWWQETVDTKVIKQTLVRAQVHWAIQLPVFSIRLFELILRTMIETYNKNNRTSTFFYKKHRMTISFKWRDFSRVFGIPSQGDYKVETKNHKLSQERKEYWVKLVGCDLTLEEMKSVVKGAKSRGLRRDFI